MNDERKTREQSLEIAKQKLHLWSRKDESINEYIWKEIDSKLDGAIYNALTSKCWEAYTFLTEFKRSLGPQAILKFTNEIEAQSVWLKTHRK